ncbi:MAG TPA: 3-dehydroquinate synthase [Actinomycetota bacterium]|nr:3-dehydroquinate synthase [Actinomycetota bacterium]
MILLIGFMGAGKTSVGRALAAALGVPLVDVDEAVEGRAGMSVADIFGTSGEPAFRELERQLIDEVLDGEDVVLALGGGSLDDPVTRAKAEWHTIVHLDVSFAEALRRVGSAVDRPMLARTDPRALYDQRNQRYREAADLTVSTNGRTPDEVAGEILQRLGLVPKGGPTRIAVTTRTRIYDVVIGSGLLPNLQEYLPPLPEAEKAFVITHPDLRPLGEAAATALRRRQLEAQVFEIPPGEESKSVGTAGGLYRRLSENEAHRHDLLVTVGGGVLTDLVGYVASTYARGMPVVHVPTTLLGQVDAAIGGKTALNLEAGKNLVGTFYQPLAVVCDLDPLATLPIEELRSGLAEIAKYGFIASPDILEFVLARHEQIFNLEGQVLKELISRCVAIKAHVVQIDERDEGPRGQLNYGHTFGHAFEHMGVAPRHGDAISLGMMAAAYLANGMKRIPDDVVHLHRRVLQALGLPVNAAVDYDELEWNWRLDKKYRRGVRFVLLKRIGEAEVGVPAAPEEIKLALERLAL